MSHYTFGIVSRVRPSTKIGLGTAAVLYNNTIIIKSTCRTFKKNQIFSPMLRVSCNSVCNFIGLFITKSKFYRDKSILRCLDVCLNEKVIVANAFPY